MLSRVQAGFSRLQSRARCRYFAGRGCAGGVETRKSVEIVLGLVAIKLCAGKVGGGHLLLFLGAVVESRIERCLCRFDAGECGCLTSACIQIVKYEQYLAGLSPCRRACTLTDFTVVEMGL